MAEYNKLFMYFYGQRHINLSFLLLDLNTSHSLLREMTNYPLRRTTLAEGWEVAPGEWPGKASLGY